MTFEVHDAMKVERVEREHGSDVHPGLDPDWDNLQRILWHAGVVQADTGIAISITTGGYLEHGREVPGIYGFSIGRHSGGAMDYRGMWDFLNGFSVGASVART